VSVAEPSDAIKCRYGKTDQGMPTFEQVSVLTSSLAWLGIQSLVRTTTRLLYTCYKPLPPGSNPIAVE